MNPNYTIIPVNKTPKIDPGDTIAIDLFLSGGGVPEKSIIYVNYNNSLVNSNDTGEIRAFVSEGRNTETGQKVPLTGEEQKNASPIKLPATKVDLPDTMFYPEPPGEPGNITHPLASESGHESHSPIEIRMNTSECSPGDYYVTVVFNYTLISMSRHSTTS